MEMTTPETPKDESVYLKLIEISLEGVIFHNYNIDVFDVLELPGFKKLHTYQYEGESRSLAELKHTYITKFCRLPVIHTNTIDYWKTPLSNTSEEEVSTLVKQMLDSYYNWESSVLEQLLALRKTVKDKTVFQGKIKDVMSEIERLETIMDILSEHDYNYDCIQEVSNYLCYQ